jgi:peptidoglycan/LPS O-acetylase OafA/YrhL
MLKTKRYEALDGLRGVAALSILWLHVDLFGTTIPKPAIAHLGVDFFFCLSGFVIAYAYQDRLSSSMSALRFLQERAIRLIPLTIVGAAIGGGAFLIHALRNHDLALPNILVATGLNAFLLPSGQMIPLTKAAFSTDSPLWSLFWEVIVNIAFALIIIRLTVFRLIALTIASAGLVIWMAIHFKGLDGGYLHEDLCWGACRVLFPFLCGVLLHKIPPVENNLAIPIGIILAGVLLGPEIGMMGEVMTVLFVFPLLVWICAGSVVGPRIGAAFVWLGRLSFPLYIINYPIRETIIAIAPKFSASHLTYDAVIEAVFSISLAWVVLTLYDEPIRAWLRKNLLRPTSKTRPIESLAGASSGGH